MSLIRIGLLGIFCLVFLSVSGQKTREAKKIEKLISNCVEKSMATSVHIIEYDTIKNMIPDGIDEMNGFSGVIVSPQGHILTVSHAAIPDQIYRITFPDGSKYIAKGLGRIGLQDSEKDYDMAMIKILDPGKWQFAQIAPSSELKLNQPVISISYPGSFLKQLPNVRFGRISDVDLSDGFIESSAKMEPGDSGGPLFDAQGRLIGVHSWIKENENINYDVPADQFLKFWTALNKIIDYKEIPSEDNLLLKAASIGIDTVPPIETIAEVSSVKKRSEVVISSTDGDRKISILGTIINYCGAIYVVSKSSEVRNSPILKVENRTISFQIIKRDKETDLILLKPSHELEKGLTLKPDVKNPIVNIGDLGKIMVSIIGKDSLKVGILSAGYTDLPLNTSKGYLGTGAIYSDNKILINRISRGSRVASTFKVNDQITGINGVVVHTAEDYNNQFEKYMAGDLISVNILRDGVQMQLQVYLSPQPTVRHVSYEYPGGRSNRSDGFKNVLIHDAAIKADKCGGAVFNSSGEFYGINIARRSRTSTIIMPVTLIAKFIKNSVSESLK